MEPRGGPRWYCPPTIGPLRSPRSAPSRPSRLPRAPSWTGGFWSDFHFLVQSWCSENPNQLFILTDTHHLAPPPPPAEPPRGTAWPSPRRTLPSSPTVRPTSPSGRGPSGRAARVLPVVWATNAHGTFHTRCVC